MALRAAGSKGDFSQLDRVRRGQAVCGAMSGLFERRRNGWRTVGCISALAWVSVATASAHSETGGVGGFVSGFHHPLSGLDHIVAMVAVGLWGAFLGGRAMWLLPVVFPMVMAFGGAAGVLGMPLPGVETGIALSGIVLGGMVAFAAKPALWVAALLVGIFAIFHGYAHGKELPDAANPQTYAVGFVISTGLLHLCGIGFGVFTKWPWGRIAVRVAGVAIMAVGCGFLFHFL
jgi:urease accessory protein